MTYHKPIATYFEDLNNPAFFKDALKELEHSSHPGCVKTKACDGEISFSEVFRVLSECDPSQKTINRLIKAAISLKVIAEDLKITQLFCKNFSPQSEEDKTGIEEVFDRVWERDPNLGVDFFIKQQEALSRRKDKVMSYLTFWKMGIEDFKAALTEISFEKTDRKILRERLLDYKISPEKKILASFEALEFNQESIFLENMEKLFHLGRNPEILNKIGGCKFSDEAKNKIVAYCLRHLPSLFFLLKDRANLDRNFLDGLYILFLEKEPLSAEAATIIYQQINWKEASSFIKKPLSTEPETTICNQDGWKEIRDKKDAYTVFLPAFLKLIPGVMLADKFLFFRFPNLIEPCDEKMFYNAMRGISKKELQSYSKEVQLAFFNKMAKEDLGVIAENYTDFSILRKQRKKWLKTPISKVSKELVENFMKMACDLKKNKEIPYAFFRSLLEKAEDKIPILNKIQERAISQEQRYKLFNEVADLLSPQHISFFSPTDWGEEEQKAAFSLMFPYNEGAAEELLYFPFIPHEIKDNYLNNYAKKRKKKKIVLDHWGEISKTELKKRDQTSFISYLLKDIKSRQELYPFDQILNLNSEKKEKKRIKNLKAVSDLFQLISISKLDLRNRNFVKNLLAVLEIYPEEGWKYLSPKIIKSLDKNDRIEFFSFQIKEKQMPFEVFCRFLNPVTCEPDKTKEILPLLITYQKEKINVSKLKSFWESLYFADKTYFLELFNQIPSSSPARHSLLELGIKKYSQDIQGEELEALNVEEVDLVLKNSLSSWLASFSKLSPKEQKKKFYDFFPRVKGQGPFLRNFPFETIKNSEKGMKAFETFYQSHPEIALTYYLKIISDKKLANKWISKKAKKISDWNLFWRLPKKNQKKHFQKLLENDCEGFFDVIPCIPIGIWIEHKSFILKKVRENPSLYSKEHLSEFYNAFDLEEKIQFLNQKNLYLKTNPLKDFKEVFANKDNYRRIGYQFYNEIAPWINFADAKLFLWKKAKKEVEAYWNDAPLTGPWFAPHSDKDDHKFPTKKELLADVVEKSSKDLEKVMGTINLEKKTTKKYVYKATQKEWLSKDFLKKWKFSSKEKEDILNAHVNKGSYPPLELYSFFNCTLPPEKSREYIHHSVLVLGEQFRLLPYLLFDSLAEEIKFKNSLAGPNTYLQEQGAYFPFLYPFFKDKDFEVILNHIPLEYLESLLPFVGREKIVERLKTLRKDELKRCDLSYLTEGEKKEVMSDDV